MTTDGQTRLTFGEALKEFGWFALLFTTVIGGASVLALLESVFVDHRLVALFQWIVDGYSRITTVVGAVFEPLFQPVVAWINGQLHLQLHLAPHWRPLFILGMVLVMGLARMAARAGEVWEAFLAVIVIGAGALIGSLISGLMPQDAIWWSQGLGAAVPTIAIFGFFGAAAAMSGGDPADRTPLGMAVAFILIAGAVAFVFGAGLSFVPGVGAGAGVLGLALIVAMFGAGFLWNGLANNDRSDAALGLTILGGFASAGLVLAANAALQAMS